MTTKTVLITGAACGIGYELAKIFASKKYALILVDVDRPRLLITKKYLENHYQASVITFTKDLTQVNSAKEIFADLRKRRLKVDILINDAGFGSLGEFKDIKIETELKMIQLNVASLTYFTKLFLEQLSNRAGKILNVSSVAAFQPGPLMAVYYATKAYILSFSEAIAEELTNTKITVTVLCPGPTATNFPERAVPNFTKKTRGRRISEMSAEKVAQAGFDGLMKNQRLVIPGGLNKLVVFLDKIVPSSSVAKIVKKLNQ
jgi:hypothetical protein